MKNTFGTSITLTLFGESHGPEIGCVIDGLTPGLRVDEESIERLLARRRPNSDLDTQRREKDPFRIVSGVKDGFTEGTPLAILIPNSDTKKEDYDRFHGAARPGHADYTGYVKYRGFNDPSGGGHFSGRLTAPIVAAGAIVLDALKAKGILVGTHILRLAGIEDRQFGDSETDIALLEAAEYPVLEASCGERMKEAIAKAKAEKDSVGGVLETAIAGLPAGLGEPWFGGVESQLSATLFGIPAVKGVSFGDGFSMADRKGSEVNDCLRYENGKVVHLSNHQGGINGGITNGCPVIFKTAVRPTPTVGVEQQTIVPKTGENTVLSADGRHDPCIAARACPVIDSVAGLVAADLLCQRFGTDWLAQ
ncbi:MAG: chorismate synthase [Clostridia bacterium]|nr:chorismate synthase [Clostridia bacterium]